MRSPVPNNYNKSVSEDTGEAKMRAAFHNLGCKVNAYETEKMIQELTEEPLLDPDSEKKEGP